jgi:hypothetical protein
MSRLKNNVKHPLITKFLLNLQMYQEYQECEWKALALLLVIQNGSWDTPRYLEKLRNETSWVPEEMRFSDKDWNTLVESGYLNSICEILKDQLLEL